MFKRINAVEVYEGQIVDENPLTGNTYNWASKISNKVVGYVAMFELTNGYSHELYMTREQVQAHAGRYSKTHKNKYGVWQTNELEMSIKTVLKLLLGRYAPMSVDYIQRAITNDQAIVKDWDGGEVEYPDNGSAQIEPEAQLETLTTLFKEKGDKLPEEDYPFVKKIIDDKEEASYAKAIKQLSAL
jgi:recombination protein RecT